MEREEEIPQSTSSRSVSHQRRVLGADAHWLGTSGGCRPPSWWLLQHGEGTFPSTLTRPRSASGMVLGCLPLGWFFLPGLSKVFFGFCRKEHVLAVLALRGLGRARRAAIFRQGYHVLESPDGREDSTLFAEIDTPVSISCF